MKPRTWRLAILAVCALTVLASIAEIFSITGFGGAPPWSGHWGISRGASSVPFHVAVTSIEPGGPSDRAGLRVGDLVDVRALSLQQHHWFIERAFNGRPVQLLLRRGDKQKSITVVPTVYNSGVDSFGILLVSSFAIWMALCAVPIAMRHSTASDMRLLASALATFALGYILSSGQSVTPSVWFDITKDVVGILASALSIVFFVLYAATFARPLSGIRRAAQWVCLATAAIFAVIGLLAEIEVLNPLIDTVFRYKWTPIGEDAQNLTFILCVALTIAATAGAERQRATWTLIPVALIVGFVIVINVAQFLPISYRLSNVIDYTAETISFTSPVALMYAALTRRFIDIGFVLNRTVVFALVSAIVIGLFIVIEWAAGAWLTAVAHADSAVVGLAVALGLGISMRYIHLYVDRFVDRIFFRKRHEDERALRHFAHEAAYITDRTVLLERALRTVEEHVTGVDAAILISNDNGAYGSIASQNGEHVSVGANDPGIVALRAWQKPLDLHVNSDSELRGEWAFPMLSRGKLIGALVCGPKRDNESYAPDESEALLELAHGVGLALDILDTELREYSSMAMLRELTARRETLEASERKHDAFRETLELMSRAVAAKIEAPQA